MTRLTLVKITHTEEKEVFGSNPGDQYDHYLGTDIVSERSTFYLLNDQELDDALSSIAESFGELTHTDLVTYTVFDSEELPAILTALNSGGGITCP